MIRFCDKEVYSVKSTEIERGMLFRHFCTEGHSLDIFMVYDEQDDYIGYITYDILLTTGTENILNYLEKSYVMQGEDIFVAAKHYFDKFPKRIWLLVCDKEKNPLCFAYQDNQRPVYELLDKCFDVLENYQDVFGINDIFPEVEEAVIYGFNEWAYRLEKICLNRGISVVRIGEKWNLLYAENEKMDIQCPDYAILNIYAEGTEYCKNMKRDVGFKFDDISKSFFFIRTLVIKSFQKRIRTARMDSRLSNHLYICKIPSFQQLKYHTERELLRHLCISLEEDGRFEEEFTKIAGMSRGELVQKQEEENKTYGKVNLFGDVRMQVYDGTEKYTIYIIGPCIVRGLGVTYKGSFPYQLQQHINENYQDWAVKTIVIEEENYDYLDETLNQLPICSKDMVIFMVRQEETKDIESAFATVDLDLLDLMNQRPKDLPWFYDVPIHTNMHGNQAVAEEVYKKLVEPYIMKEMQNDNVSWIQQGQYLSEKGQKRLKQYIDPIKMQTKHIPETAKIGAIVMNCNPFTLGHLYLIEEAKKIVDYLFIFIVEENRSEFNFEDRIRMVKSGTKHLNNIQIFPSGEFILSQKTFPSYFQKDDLQEEYVDVSLDVNIFAQYIAKELRISVRFVGEEPIDNVTNQYNREMKRVLQQYGLQFIEIPRKEQIRGGGVPISASQVRKLLLEGDWEKIKYLVPQSTFKYLHNIMGVNQ